MISFFTIAKPFSGHIAVIQRNALQSWKRLHDDCEVILIGDDRGCAEVAREFGLIHEPNVGRNEYGSALVNDLFAIAHARARHGLLCYVNADIILLPDFIHAARQVRDLNQPFLLCGRRWNLDVTGELTFDSRWDERLRREVVERGYLHNPKCVDYFLFTRGIFGDIPPFAIGRRRWDRWLQYRARFGPGLYIDATEAVTAIHQNHDYGPVGFVGHKRGLETQRNIELAGDQFCDLHQATLKLTRAGIKRAIDSTRIRWRLQNVGFTLARRLQRVEDWIKAKLGNRRPRRLLRASKALRRFLKSGSPKRQHRIAIVGLGKVGFPLALCLAYKGCTVVGVDADARKLAAIRSGKPPFLEKGVIRLLSQSKDRLTVMVDAEKAMSKANVILLVLPTQRADQGGFTPEHLLAACATVGRVLINATGYRLVVIVSTVLPGWTGGTIQTTLEQTSGKKAGSDFGLCYWPVFIALGEAVKGFLSPEFVLIGESDPVAGKCLQTLLAQVWDRPARVVRTNFINAELAKLALNTYVSTKISFANVLAQICEQLPGANVDAVTSILQLDCRIGRGFLTGGMSYGGACFPTDVPAFAAFAEELGVPGDLALATDYINKQVIRRVVGLIQKTTPFGKTVGVCGISFKPGTGAVDGSPGIRIAQQLEETGYPVLMYDPQPTEKSRNGPNVFEIAESFEECIRRSHTVVLAMPCEEFSHLTPELLQTGNTRRTVIDCWRIVDRDKVDTVADYHALGLGPRAGAMQPQTEAREPLQGAEPRRHSQVRR